MTLSQTTKTLLSEITTLSGNTLQRAMDLGTLIELASLHSRQQVLDDLAFSAKFITKSFELMQRIGKDGNGYEKLAAEFTAQVTRSQELLRAMLVSSDAMTNANFSGNYLEMNTLTLENLMKLYHDLSWYKNYRIDHATK
ncbi:MAG: hypothetical protein KBF97_02855 [Bacteroidetes bacterium]|nr:hypothetical protein [Bacteroidota bacterium]